MGSGEFGAYLRQMRRARGWTQEELAAAAGVDQASVSQYERAIHVPSPEVLRRLADALGLPLADLARRAGYPVEALAPADPAHAVPIADVIRLLEGEPAVVAQLADLKEAHPAVYERALRRVAEDLRDTAWAAAALRRDLAPHGARRES